MALVASIDDGFFKLVLFGLIFCSICWVFSSSQHQLSSSSSLIGQFKPLTCLLEDAPESSLTGQFYPLATPIACLLEDAPESSLTGQFYPLATPIACIWELGWISFYNERLAKPGINYWEWRDQPLLAQVVPELSWLLRLPEPQATVKGVLESLAGEHQSFWNWGNLCAFSQWHQQAVQQLGSTSLRTIYQVGYRTSWESLELLLRYNSPPLHRAFFDESSPWWKILGINPFASSLQVEQAYKKLLRLWHPDRTLHPLAHQITACLNKAYEQYQRRHHRHGWFRRK